MRAAAAATTTVWARTTSLVASASKRVGHWFEHHPVISNSILCLNLWVAGDCLAQYSEDRWNVAGPASHDNGDDAVDGAAPLAAEPQPKPPPASTVGFWTDRYDPGRTARCAGFGAVVSGPVLAVWYPFLDRVCLRYRAVLRGPWAAPAAKVAADEFLMDPPMLVFFFGSATALEGGTAADCLDTVRTQFWPSWTTSLAVWPAVLLGTFRFLPVPVQAPVINAGCVLWDGFLSYRKSLAKQQQQQQQQERQQSAPAATPEETNTH